LLSTLLLNEFLKEHKRAEELGKTIAAQGRTNAELAKATVEQEQQVHAMTVQLKGDQDMKLTVAAQAQTIAAQQKQIEALTASMEKMTQQMNAVAQRLDGKDYQPVVNHMGGVPGE
jgi:uncharacterized coiled-coil protein SlyX